MVESNKIFGVAMKRLERTFNRSLTNEQRLEYRQALSDVADDDLVEATTRAIRTLKFFPRPVELIECIPSKPIKRRGIQEIDHDAGISRTKTTAPHENPALDRLTRAQVYDILKPLWDDSLVCKEEIHKHQAAENMTDRFFAGDKVVRLYVGDCLK